MAKGSQTPKKKPTKRTAPKRGAEKKGSQASAPTLSKGRAKNASGEAAPAEGRPGAGTSGAAAQTVSVAGGAAVLPTGIVSEAPAQARAAKSAGAENTTSNAGSSGSGGTAGNGAGQTPGTAEGQPAGRAAGKTERAMPTAAVPKTYHLDGTAAVVGARSASVRGADWAQRFGSVPDISSGEAPNPGFLDALEQAAADDGGLTARAASAKSGLGNLPNPASGAASFADDSSELTREYEDALADTELPGDAVSPEGMSASRSGAPHARPSKRKDAPAKTDAEVADAADANGAAGASPTLRMPGAKDASRKKKAPKERSAAPVSPGQTPENSSDAPDKKRKGGLFITRHPVITFLIVLGIFGAVIGLFSWHRWGYYDDLATMQGTWYANGSDTTMVISGSQIEIDDGVVFDLELDPFAKTIKYSFGAEEGQGRYRFSLDRNRLVITDGEDFTWFNTLTEDIPWLFGSLWGMLTGQTPEDSAEQEGAAVFDWKSADTNFAVTPKTDEEITALRAEANAEAAKEKKSTGTGVGTGSKSGLSGSTGLTGASGSAGTSGTGTGTGTGTDVATGTGTGATGSSAGTGTSGGTDVDAGIYGETYDETVSGWEDGSEDYAYGTGPAYDDTTGVYDAELGYGDGMIYDQGADPYGGEIWYDETAVGDYGYADDSYYYADGGY